MSAVNGHVDLEPGHAGRDSVTVAPIRGPVGLLEWLKELVRQLELEVSKLCGC